MFVGRDRELDTVLDDVRRLQRYEGVAPLVVEGARGAGKTTLLGRGAVGVDAMGWSVGQARVGPDGAGLAVHGALRSAAERLLAWRPGSRAAAALVARVDAERDRFAPGAGPADDLFADLLARAARVADEHHRGVVLFLDDLEAAAPEEAAALVGAASSISGAGFPATLVAARRAHQPDRLPARSLALTPLDAHSLGTVALTCDASADWSPDGHDALAVLAEGNPLLAGAYARHALATGHRPVDGAAVHAGRPEADRELCVRLLGIEPVRLPGGQRRLLQAVVAQGGRRVPLLAAARELGAPLGFGTPTYAADADALVRIGALDREDDDHLTVTFGFVARAVADQR